MKKLSLFLSAGFLASAGCVSVSDSNLKELDARIVVKTATPITADQVTAENAHRAAQVLSEEIDPEHTANAQTEKTKSSNRK